MAKDILDKDTHDAFITFEQLERETMIGNALATGGHYQAVKPCQYYKVSGNRPLVDSSRGGCVPGWTLRTL